MAPDRARPVRAARGVRRAPGRQQRGGGEAIRARAPDRDPRGDRVRPLVERGGNADGPAERLRHDPDPRLGVPRRRAVRGRLLLGARRRPSAHRGELGTQGSYRRSRHVLAFSAVPVALSLVLWPLKLALFGSALFRAGGDDSGAMGKVFAVAWLGFLAWSICLLVLGVRAVHGWTWLRAAVTALRPPCSAACSCSSSGARRARPRTARARRRGSSRCAAPRETSRRAHRRHRPRVPSRSRPTARRSA